ncbi:xanthine phosphoribosyltransferase [Hathewaya limosa]|uniref:Xanthine phosphoribosyltransferase n=1 Tax=Hathewaya limosa TaxID=1536 RepID=A0ABU0JN75_HATLI|nr:xanthine phosphoribosyltransferase [Hathewaya limosa]AWZ49206.1 xanthine phosphoribosyltransferase [Clostridiaceae bacterium 14S0207]MDQ0478513.1 xanthine phosphoribosyltransferase [Hathewaya limosa]
MNLLKEKILNEGEILAGNLLKVDMFLNHQMDIKLFNEMGKEFKERFKNDEINKILTIEASGIGIACIAAQYFDYIPVVFAKKVAGSNLDKECYESEVFSFTKNTRYNVKVSKKYLNKGDKVLIIDDFLANGCAALGLIDIVRQAGAEPVGVGIVIEKGFQKGRKAIEDVGVKVESLAILESIENGKVTLK